MGFKVASRVRGLSDEAFREAFGAEEQCRSALSRLRWPDGFVCPSLPFIPSIAETLEFCITTGYPFRHA